MAASIGAWRLKECAFALEQACQAADAAAIAAAWPSFEAVLAQTLEALRPYQNEAA